MVPRLRTVIKQFRPDILHTHLYVLRYVLPALWPQQRTGIVHTVHNVANKEVGIAGRILHRFAFRYGAVAPVSIARGVAQTVTRQYGIPNLPVIPNGIPIEDYANGTSRGAVRTELGIREDEIVFVTIGRLTKQKNQFLLLQSLAEARGRIGAPIRCLIVGTGELEFQLKSASCGLGISDCVQFLGNRRDIPHLLSAADVFVLSSDWEGNPLSLMEAMAAGKPVIATTVGGVPEMLEHSESGLLVPQGSVQALAHAMILLASNPPIRDRLGHHAAILAKQRFGVSAMVEAYETLYLQKVKGSKPRARASAAS
jgi:glycosyltransferase involved in cell wall biosynthesis